MSKPTLLIKGKLVGPYGADTDPELVEKLKEEIPMDYILSWFGSRLSKTGIENRVLVLKSETASGKSTALPPAVYKQFVYNKRGPGLICTQPRVLTAIENVMEMLKHYSSILRLGDTIGWSTQYNKIRPKKFSMLSATIGTLTQILKSSTDEEIMEKFRFIMIDETHERDLQTDMTISMLKNLLSRVGNHPMCPFVVLMSATFDPDPLLDYFGVNRLTNFIWCGGATAKIDEMWDWKPAGKDYPEMIGKTVDKICREGVEDVEDKGDILVFLPGASEMKAVSQHLSKVNESLAKSSIDPFTILKLDSVAVNTQNEDYRRLISVPLQHQEVWVNKESYRPRRRVILSTNVAETGLTLDGLKYVIDAGYNKETEYNPVYGTMALITKPAPRSRIRQRRGRSGRKFPGVFYPMYSFQIHESLPLLQFPQILTNDVSTIMMDIIREQLKTKARAGLPQIFKVSDIDMIDAPTPDAIADAMWRLYNIGFVSPFGSGGSELTYGLTRLGELGALMAGLPPELARMILAGYSWKVRILDLISIAVWVNLEADSGLKGVSPEWAKANPTKVPPGIKWDNVYNCVLGVDEDFYKMRILIGDNFIDGMFFSNALMKTLGDGTLETAASRLREFCNASFISYDRAIAFLQQRDKIIEALLTEGFSLDNIPDSEDISLMEYVTKIKYCIYDGYRSNLLTRDGDVYKTSRGLEVVAPSVFHSEEKVEGVKKHPFIADLKPKYIVYNQLELSLNKKTNIFRPKVSIISVLDGFIAPDQLF
jgi:HrpA-like RNA helicase